MRWKTVRAYAPLPVLVALAALPGAPALAQSPTGPEGWGGLYIGLLGVSTDSKTTGTSRQGNGEFGSNANAEAANLSTYGRSAGAVLGYQHQYPNGIIAGLEVDWAALNHKDRQDVLVDSNNAWLGMPGASIQRETEWISTARLRLGYGDGPWMINATAGLALASMVQTRTQYQGLNPPARVVAAFSDTDRVMPLGWTLGLGGAWQIAEGWSLRLDYLHAQFDQVRFSFPNARGGVNSVSNSGGFFSVQGRDVRNDVTMRMLRFGVTYTFGEGAFAAIGQGAGAPPD